MSPCTERCLCSHRKESLTPSDGAIRLSSCQDHWGFAVGDWFYLLPSPSTGICSLTHSYLTATNSFLLFQLISPVSPPRAGFSYSRQPRARKFLLCSPTAMRTRAQNQNQQEPSPPQNVTVRAQTTIPTKTTKKNHCQWVCRRLLGLHGEKFAGCKLKGRNQFWDSITTAAPHHEKQLPPLTLLLLEPRWSWR